MLRFYEEGPICFSFDRGELAIRVVVENGEKDTDKALDALAKLECELEEDGIEFKVCKRACLGTPVPIQRTDAIVIDYAMPDAFKKLTKIFEKAEPPNQGG